MMLRNRYASAPDKKNFLLSGVFVLVPHQNQHDTQPRLRYVFNVSAIVYNIVWSELSILTIGSFPAWSALDPLYCILSICVMSFILKK
jgi:hypothetical protein